MILWWYDDACCKRKYVLQTLRAEIFQGSVYKRKLFYGKFQKT